MNKIKLKNFEESILFLAVFFVVLFTGETFFFLLAGLNKTILFWSMPVQLVVFTILAYKFIFPSTKFSNKLFLFGLLAFIILNSFFFHPGTLEYHDQGVYSNAAIYFSKHDSFIFYQEGIDTLGGISKRLNGDGYVIHKSPAYIAYLTPFYYFFGFNGFIFANAILLFFSLLSIYLLANRFVRKEYCLIPIVFIFISFPIFWFSRTTFSEILAMFLFWTTLYAFFKARDNLETPLLFLFPLYSSLLMVLARYEGFASTLIFVFLISLLIFIKHKSRLGYLFLKLVKSRSSLFFLILIFFELSLILIYLLNFLTWIHEMNVVTSLDWLVRGFTTQETGSVTNYPFNFNILLFLFSFFSFYFYGLGVFMLAAVMGVISELRGIRKSTLDIILISILAAPGIYFFINPSISLYHPWAARRWFPIAIPFVVLVGFLYLFKLIKNRKVLTLIVTAIFTLNIIKAIPAFFFIQGRGVPKMIEKIGSRLPKDIPVFFWDTYGIDGYSAPIFFNYGGEIYHYEQYREIDIRLGLKELINQSQFEKIINKKGKVFLVSCLKKEALQTTYLKDYDIKYLLSDDFELEWIKSEGIVRDFLYFPVRFKSYWDIIEMLKDLPPHESQKQPLHVNYYEVTPKNRETASR